ncbi:MEDS domain-containing protein [Candidatus Nitrososphaera gargensis]|nr:MEDS domain-containing protein [Candidatus Nitrososphaera gargensis]
MHDNNTHSFMCTSNWPLLQSSCKQPQQGLALSHPFYEKIAQYLSQDYAVVYIVENNTTQVVRNLSKMGLAVEDFIENGILTIIDADSFYSPLQTKLDYKILLTQWQKIVSSVSKNGKFKRVILMGMPHQAFFESKENQKKLVEYEEEAAKCHDGSFQVFCCYTKELIDKLPLSHLIRLVIAHQNIVSSNSNNDNQEAIVSRIVDIVEEGLTKALGSETSILVLKTLRLIYKIDKGDIKSNPELFEEKLKRIIGEEVAGLVLKIIADRIKDEIVFY